LQRDRRLVQRKASTPVVQLVWMSTSLAMIQGTAAPSRTICARGTSRKQFAPVSARSIGCGRTMIR